MYNILTLNKIAKCGTSKFDAAKYTCSDACDAPDAIMVRSAAMHDMAFADNTVAIARAGAGVNNIPVDACADKGIVVFNTPGANANAVKELVVCALFMSSRKISEAIGWCGTLKGEGDAVGKLVEKGKSAFAGPEIGGKTLGVVGLGAIGILVAQAASLLGMKIVGYDPFLSDSGKAKLPEGTVIVEDVKELFAVSDYITLHVPLNDATRGMINKDTIAGMKDSVRILNFARGDLVDPDDIIAALESEKVAAYVTDFPTDAQIGAKGVTAIPHLGASTPESEDNCAMMAADELINYIEKGEIKNSVNFPNAALPCDFDHRVCVLYKAGEGVAEKLAAAAGAAPVFSGEKKGNGYSVFDAAVDANALSAVDGVVRVRVIK